MRRFLSAAVAGSVPALACLCAGRLFRAVTGAVVSGVTVGCGSRLLRGRGSLALRTGLRSRCGQSAAAMAAAGAAAALPLRSPVLRGGRRCSLRVLVRREGVAADLLDAPAGEPQDARVVLALGGGAEGHGRAAQPGAARAADAVHICFRHIGDVVVHDERQLLDVDAAGGDVRGHEDAALPLLEGGERRLACALRLVSVDRLGCEAAAVQVAGDAVRAVLRAGEHEHGGRVPPPEEPGEQTALVRLIDEADVLADRLHRAGGRIHLHHGHIVQEPVRDLLDLGRHRGGKEQRLLLLRQAIDHAADVVQKAHVEHTVRLVEHEDLNPGEIGQPLADEVVEPARRGDEHVHAALQRGRLRGLAHAAEHDGVLERQAASVLFKAFEDLQRQLPRGGEHQRAHRPPAVRQILRGQPLQHRHSEGGRFARARLRAAEQIAALQHGRDGRLLDGGGGLITGRLERFQNRGNDAKLFKCHTILHPAFIVDFSESMMHGSKPGCFPGRPRRIPKGSKAIF